MNKIENIIAQITAENVQFLTLDECREVLATLAWKTEHNSEREAAILEACEDRVYEVEWGEYEAINDSGADAEALASAGFGTDEDYGYFGDAEEYF